MPMTSHLETQLGRLENFVQQHDYAGYDPYDALNSPVLRAATGRTKWGRIACTQLLKRCPVNLRPFLGIRPGQNPKALGLFLEGYARRHRREPCDNFADSAAYLIRRLAELSTPTRSGHGWGYNFDWPSRAFFVPKFNPSLICSSVIAHALLDAAEVFGSEEAYRFALPVGDFFLRDLNR